MEKGRRHAKDVAVKALVLALCAGGIASPAIADEEKHSGEHVYREVCAACHSTKFDKAPQVGDRKTWAPLIKEGQHVLTAHAWVGVRNMPPKGGKNDLALEEFARAVAYMARESGGKWKDPDEAMLAKIRAEEKKRRQAMQKAKK
jgi:cytochrome c5